MPSRSIHNSTAESNGDFKNKTAGSHVDPVHFAWIRNLDLAKEKMDPDPAPDPDPALIKPCTSQIFDNILKKRRKKKSNPESGIAYFLTGPGDPDP